MSKYVQKPAAELYITRPDRTVVRFVKPQATNSVQTKTNGKEIVDEDMRVVAECAPYTASFNNLLAEVRPNENPLRFVALVHDRMIAEGVPMNIATYNHLMKRVVRFTEGPIFDLYNELKEEGMKPNSSVRPDLETYRLLFRACERGAQYSKAFILYQQMRDIFHIVPDTITYNTLLGYCAAVGDVAQASYFMQEMRDNGVPQDTNSYNCYMSALVGNTPYEETLKAFYEIADHNLKPSNRTYNTVIKAARVHNDYNRAFQLFEEMKKKGLLPDVMTYNNLLWICEQRLDYVKGTGQYAKETRTQAQLSEGKSALCELAVTLIAEMVSIGVSPNTFSYNKVLSIMLDCRDYRIFSIYQKILSSYDSDKAAAGKTSTSGNSVMNSRLQNPLELAMACEDPQSDGAIGALGVHPNLLTYKLIIRAFNCMGYSAQCKNLYEHMKVKGVHMDHEMGLILLRTCKTMKDKEWAQYIINDAATQILLIDTELYNAYIDVLAACGDASLVSEFEMMCMGINEFGAKADVGTYNAMLRGYLNLDEVNKGIALYARMRSPYSDVVPNDETFVIMTELYGAMHDADFPTSEIESIVNQKIPIGIEVYHGLMRLYASLCDTRIEELFSSLRDGTNVDPLMPPRPKIDLECYAILMRYYFNLKKMDRALGIFDDLKKSNTLEPTAEVYDILFDMYSVEKDTRALVSLFDDARMHSVKLSLPMYNKLIETFVDSSQSAFVFDIAADMKLNRVPPSEETMAIFIGSANGRAILSKLIARDAFYSQKMVR